MAVFSAVLQRQATCHCQLLEPPHSHLLCTQVKPLLLHAMEEPALAGAGGMGTGYLKQRVLNAVPPVGIPLWNPPLQFSLLSLWLHALVFPVGADLLFNAMFVTRFFSLSTLSIHLEAELTPALILQSVWCLGFVLVRAGGCHYRQMTLSHETVLKPLAGTFACACFVLYNGVDSKMNWSRFLLSLCAVVTVIEGQFGRNWFQKTAHALQTFWVFSFKRNCPDDLRCECSYQKGWAMEFQ